MQVLADGHAVLYKNSHQYYVQKGSESLKELVSVSQDTTVYRSGRPYIARNRLFANLLNDQVMADCPAVQPLLQKALLRDGDLMAIFEVYNHCRPANTPTRLIAVTAKPRTSVSMGIGLSWHRSTLSILPTNWVPVNAILHPTRSFIPYPTCWLVLTSPRISERFSFQTGLSFLHEAFRFSSTEEIDEGADRRVLQRQDLWLQMSSLRIPVQVRYNVPGFQARPYLAVGSSLLLPLRYESSYSIERQQNRLVNSFRYPFFVPHQLAISVTGALGLKIPLNQNFSGVVEGRYEMALAGIAQFDNIDATKAPHAAGLTSLAEAPYQAFQFSLGLQFR
ncbi:hypothetical protein GCM10023189_38620 [Nibrella saemangeumensis]|uniref:Outer membrane protein beta-barrel domain-containing protein n=2 Tax=Nibrella saemangeumensis TaxID=1084526 RepID=A0ABP8N9D9_9BACT